MMQTALTYLAMVLIGGAMQFALRLYETKRLLKAAERQPEDLPGGRAAMRAYLAADAFILWACIPFAFLLIDFLEQYSGLNVWVALPIAVVAVMLANFLAMRLTLSLSAPLRAVSDALTALARELYARHRDASKKQD